MPGVQTYTLIQEQTLSSSAASVTFSSIPQIYEDLILEVTGSFTAGGNLGIQINGDTGSNYSRTVMYGSGSSAASFRESNISSVLNSGYFDTGIGTTTLQFMSYSSPNVFKTFLVRSDPPGTGTYANVCLWRSTSAITSIQASAVSTTFASGMTLRLFGLVA